MENSISMAPGTQTEPIIIPSIGNNNLYDHPTTGTWVTYLGIHRHFQHTWLDAQGIIRLSERQITLCHSSLYWLDHRH